MELEPENNAKFQFKLYDFIIRKRYVTIEQSKHISNQSCYFLKLAYDTKFIYNYHFRPNVRVIDKNLQFEINIYPQRKRPIFYNFFISVSALFENANQIL